MISPPNSILGMDALEHETVWNVMYRRSLDFARRGTFMAGLSAIDIALWDIKVSTQFISSAWNILSILKGLFLVSAVLDSRASISGFQSTAFWVERKPT